MRYFSVALAFLAFFGSLRTEAVIALNTPTFEFNALNMGGPSDPVADNQANKPDIELVGNDSAELYAFYGGFLDNGSSSTTDGDVFYRVRVAGNSGQAELGGYVFIGLDITGDGALDYYIQHGGNPTQQIAILRADLTAANDSPDTIGLGDTLFTTDVVEFGNAGANSYFTDVADIDPGLSATPDYDPYDLDDGSDADHFLTFSFDFAELVNVIRTDAANDSLNDDLDDSFEWFDDSFSMQMVLTTSQDVNNINSDLGGIDGASTETFTTGGGISPEVDPGGSHLPEPATYALLFGLFAFDCAAYRRRR